MRVVGTIKYYKDEGFVERIIELHYDDLTPIIEEYLAEYGGFDYDEIEIVDNHPMNRLKAKCRKYIDREDPEDPEDEQVAKAEAEVTVAGEYPDDLDD
jgi:hypothetical protein